MSERTVRTTPLWPAVGEMHLACTTGGTGDGPPLVLLHGGGLDNARSSWGPVFAPLAAARRVIAPDLPGYGRSDLAPDAPHALGWYAEVLAGLLDALGIERTHLAGLSLGGGVALAFALRYPDRVARLALVASYGLGAGLPGGAAGAIALRLPGVGPLTYAALARSRTLVRAALGAALVNRGAITEAFVDDALLSLRRPGSTRAWQRFQRHEANWPRPATDFRPLLSALRIPTLLLHGADDRLLPVRATVEAHALIPGSRLEVFPHCGHWVPRDAPERFVTALNGFLAVE